MWHWLRKKLPRADNLWVRLAGFSCAAHLVVFCALFLTGSNGESRSFDLAVQRDLSQARIVLLPLYRVVPQELNKNFVAGGGDGKGGSGVTQSSNMQTVQGTRPATRLFIDTAAYTAKKKATAKRLAAKKAKIERDRLKREEAKKKKLKERQAALEKVKREREDEARKKAEREEKAALEKKIEEKPIIKTPAVPVEQPLTEQPVVEQSATEHVGVGQGSGSGIAGDNVYYVGRDELEQYRENSELREALADVWHPPCGIEPEAPCKLVVVVDKNGSAARVTVESSSGVLVYDSAAQAALFEAVFPEREHGKVLYITFR
jgi:outer membrane biosynthesis protein TonB